jgi:hypothetical protein
MENAIISYRNTTYLQLSLLVENFLSVEPSLRHGRKVYSLKPVFHSIISPPLMKKNWQGNHVFTFIRHRRNLFRLSSCWKCSTFVRLLRNGAKEQGNKFFGCEIFRAHRTGITVPLFEQNKITWLSSKRFPCEVWRGVKLGTAAVTQEFY